MILTIKEGGIPDHFMKVKPKTSRLFSRMKGTFMMRFSCHFSVQSAASCLLSHFLLKVNILSQENDDTCLQWPVFWKAD